MKFYFCETCGKRLTEKDVEAGQARDKKLKGIFCAACSVGVMTMEMMPVSKDEALKILGKSPTPASGAPFSPGSTGKPGRDSERMKAAGPARASEAAIRAMHAAPHASNAKPNNAMVGITAGLVVAVLVGVFLLASGGDKHKQPETAKPAAPQTPPPPVRPIPPAASGGPMNTPPANTPPTNDGKTEPRNVAAPELAEPTRVPESPAPPPATQVPNAEPASQPKPPAVVDTPKPPDPVQAQPPAAAPDLPPIFTEEQRAALRFYDDLMAKLASRQLDAALGAAKNSKLAEAASLAPLLERAGELQKKALEALNKKPPAAPLTIKFKGAELSGQLKRVEGPFAWVVSKGLEIRVGVDELPFEIFLDALALDANTPDGQYDLTAYQFASGKIDAAFTQAKRLDTAKSAGLVGYIDRYLALQRLAKFEAAALALEAPIKEARAQDASKLLDNLKKTYADLAEGSQKERFADLEKRVEGAKIVNRLAKDMIGYWNFDEEQGTIAKDSSGAGNDGTISGPKWVKGKFGGGLSFAVGSTDWVAVPNMPGTNVSDNFTLACWVLPNAKHLPATETNTGANGMRHNHAFFPCCYGTLHDAGAGIAIGTNGVCVFEHAGGYLPSLLVFEKEITEWTHVAVVYVDKQPKLYLNGKYVHSGIKSALIVHPTVVGFGGKTYGSFGGILDEVRVYSRSLSDNEVAKLAEYNVSSK